MKHTLKTLLHLKPYQLALLACGFLSVFSLIVLNGPVASAASQKATRVCKEANDNQPKQQEACEFGYDWAEAGKNSADLCHGKYGGTPNQPAQNTACIEGGNLQKYGKKSPTQADVEKNEALQLGEEGKFQCGNLPKEGDNYKTKLNFGCLGKKGPVGLGPIQDLVFAIIRFASAGVGIVIILSIIMAGIQYSAAEGNAEATHKAKLRIQQAVIGLIIYIFAFSILQFLIPGGIFKPGYWLLDPLILIKGILP